MQQKTPPPQQPEIAQKPMRLRIVSELGQAQSLASGREAFTCLDVSAFATNPATENGAGQAAVTDKLLLLGLGPDPARLPDLLRESGWSGGEVYYLECPEFAAQMPPEWRNAIPDNFHALPLQREFSDPAASCLLYGLPQILERVETVWQYAQSARLFPSFWGPVLGYLKLRELGVELGHINVSQTNSGHNNVGHINAAGANAVTVDLVVDSVSAVSATSAVSTDKAIGFAGSGNSGGSDVGNFPDSSAGCLHHKNIAPRTRHIILVSTEHSLLHVELHRAFQQLGYAVSALPPRNNEKSLARLLCDPNLEPPALFLSLNCEGFGALGENFYLLKQAGVPCASWFVDNPWYSLSGLRAPFWKELNLFCTDKSFITPLKACGAAKVEHLPLAVDPQVFFPPAQKLPEFPLLFVGRSAFPGKSGFFAGLSVPHDLHSEALSLLEQGNRPDFNWWSVQLGLTGQPAGRKPGLQSGNSQYVEGVDSCLQTMHPAPGTPDANQLWLGKETRLAGLGAENASAAWRTGCLKAALLFKPVIYGDPGWHDLLPAGVQVHEPVDYYHGLPQLYAAARFTLNATSLLLPAGLNQRHFDVWAAGGFLITDATPGLDIFPQELVKAVSFRKSSEIPQLLMWLNNSSEYLELKKAWREEILARHCYCHRVRQMLESLNAS